MTADAGCVVMGVSAGDSASRLSYTVLTEWRADMGKRVVLTDLDLDRKAFETYGATLKQLPIAVALELVEEALTEAGPGAVWRTERRR